MHGLKWCHTEVPSNLGSRGASSAFPTPSSQRQVPRSAYLETTHEPGNSSGLEGREVGFRVLAAQAVYRWAMFLTVLNLSVLTFKMGAIIQLRNELTGQCHSSASHSPVASHSTGRKIQRPRTPCMTTQSPTTPLTWSPTPTLVQPRFSKHIRLILTHLRAFALALPGARFSPGDCAAPPHLSGLCSNISISVRPSKNPLKWHHPFPTYSASTSSKILTPWTQNIFMLFSAATHAQNNVGGTQ